MDNHNNKGVGAALTSGEGIVPRELENSKIQQTLLDQGVYLKGTQNNKK